MARARAWRLVLAGLALAALTAAVVIVLAPLSAAGAPPPLEYVTLLVEAIVVLSIILAWLLAHAVIMVEGATVRGAFARSRHLTRGLRSRIVGSGLLVVVPPALVTGILGAPLVLRKDPSTAAIVADQALATLGNVASLTLAAVVTLLWYRHAKAKERARRPAAA